MVTFVQFLSYLREMLTPVSLSKTFGVEVGFSKMSCEWWKNIQAEELLQLNIQLHHVC